MTTAQRVMSQLGKSASDVTAKRGGISQSNSAQQIQPNGKPADHHPANGTKQISHLVPPKGGHSITLEERIKAALGEQSFTIAVLMTENEKLRARVAELETEKSDVS